MIEHRSPLRRAAAATLAVSLLAGGAGCTDDPEKSAESPSPLPSRSVESGTTLAAKPVPMRVSLAVVPMGKVGRARQDRIKGQIGWVLDRYFQDAFLGGEYPREDFGNPFAMFTPAAAARAGRDRALLTNAPTADVNEAVVPVVKRAHIRALSFGRLLPGATAFVRLVFREERTEGPPQRVTVTGRLLLTSLPRGAWRIFGYDIKRWAVPAKGADS